ncbi:MAG TPA: hypothetical protein VMY35_18375 [Phycisphaerae bacterium]|nr:hypothetical protein [Phycisphaerae bacterium]
MNETALIVLVVKVLPTSVLAVAVAALAAGCGSASRGWEQASLATHDREKAFEAARKVLGRHFGVAEANWVRGEIRSRPKVLDRERAGTLADVRGAGGRWRGTAVCEIDREGLVAVARVTVRLEREATAATAVMADTGREDQGQDKPPSVPRMAEPGPGTDREVWVETGYDRPMARDLLAEIVQEVQRLESRETLPPDQSPQDIVEESRQMGAEQGF